MRNPRMLKLPHGVLRAERPLVFTFGHLKKYNVLRKSVEPCTQKSTTLYFFTEAIVRFRADLGYLSGLQRVVQKIETLHVPVFKTALGPFQERVQTGLQEERILHS